MVKIEDLRGCNLFDGLDEAELASIASLCTRRTFQPNTVIFDPGSTTSEVYILEGGNDSVQIEIPVNAGKSRVILHTLSKGETFGWAPLCPTQVRTAIARAIDKATVIVIEGNELIRLLEANNHMGYVVMRNLSCIISLRLDYVVLVLRNEVRNLRKKVTV